MGGGQGDIPLLSNSFVAGMFEENMQLNEAPVYEFVLSENGGSHVMYPTETVSFDAVRQQKGLATLKGTPDGVAEVVEDPRHGQVKMTALYTHQKGGLKASDVSKLRQAGQNPGYPFRRFALDTLGKKLAAIRAHSVRTSELWLCNLLQGGSFNQSVNGLNQSITTGITAQNIGGNFATASTDIPGRLAYAAEQHEQQAGAPVDLIICSSAQRANFGLNDKIRDYVIRQGNMAEVFPKGLSSDLFVNARWMMHRSKYNDSAGAAQRYWSATKLAMISFSPQPLVVAGTCPVTRPDGTDNFESPYTQHQWTKNETGALWVREVAAFLYGMLDISKITVWNTNA